MLLTQRFTNKRMLRQRTLATLHGTLRWCSSLIITLNNSHQLGYASQLLPIFSLSTTAQLRSLSPPNTHSWDPSHFLEILLNPFGFSEASSLLHR